MDQTLYRKPALLIAIFVLLISWVLPLKALDPVSNISDFLQKNWTRESGLPQNTIFSLTQDQYGFLWIGTPSGLVRFDGLQFKVYNRQNTPVLKNDCITTLHLDMDGRLWIGTEGGGAYFLQNREWTALTIQEGLSHDYVRTITSDFEGNVWIGTDHGLNRFSSEGLQQYTTHQGLTDNMITTLAMDKEGFLWIGTHRGGLMQFMNGIVRIYSQQQNLTAESILSLYSDHRNHLWIGTMQGLYYMHDGEGRIHYVSQTAHAPITSIIENPEGTLWIGSMTDGLWRIHEGKLTGQGKTSRYIRSLLFDRQNHLWIGSDASGLYQLKDRMIDNITRKNGLPGRAVNTVLQDQQGNFWIGMMNGGLSCMRKNKVSMSLGAADGLIGNRVTTLQEDSRGDLWIGTADGGLNILRGNTLEHLSQREGLTSNTITSILEDQFGNIWIGTDHGLNQLENDKIAQIVSTTLSTHHIRTLKPRKEGGFFIGTKAGLVTYNSSRGTTEVHSRLNELDILSIHQDQLDNLWLGTNGNGLYCQIENELLSWTTHEGLPDNHIFSITEDDSGDLWMSSYRGVFRVTHEELFKVSRSKIPFLICDIFDESEGMVSSRCSVIGKPAVWKSFSGQIYFATAAGISIFDPKNFVRKPRKLPLYIEAVIADGHSVSLGESTVLSYPLNQLNISFSFLNYTSPGKTRFYYKLEGHDSSWLQLSPPLSPDITYLDLIPGHYNFHITAISHTGSVGEATMAFRIITPFYRSTLFWISFIAIILAGAGVAYYTIYQHKIRRRGGKYKTSSLDPQKADEVIPQLLRLMEEEKLYLNANLNLKIIAKRVRIHYNHLSRIINERFDMNYNDFINRYRIQEAKEMLLSKDGYQKNILEIMYDTGFYSKSVFNTAFKKFTGMTPSEFKQCNPKTTNK